MNQLNRAGTYASGASLQQAQRLFITTNVAGSAALAMKVFLAPTKVTCGGMSLNPAILRSFF